MRRRFFLGCAAAVLGSLVFSQAGPLQAGSVEEAGQDYRLSGPFTHKNLAIYLVHGGGAPGPVPLTLQEALETDSVRVYETSNVNELSIENLGDEAVFVQAGDIVKGGKQDRVLTVSLILPPRSGKTAIGSFCVEQGRWHGRGQERADSFGSSAAVLPSREAKLAMKAPRSKAPSSAAADTGTRQQDIWKNVAKIQDKLSKSLGGEVAAEASPSSLQLALEDGKLAAAQTDYIEALQGLGDEASDVIGYAFAINGKINSADVYPSNGLFTKMWPKLLRASAAEAIGEAGQESGEVPPAAAVLAFLRSAEKGRASREKLTDTAEQETRDGVDALFVETRSAKGDWAHRNYLTK